MTRAGSYEPLAGEERIDTEESSAFKSLLEQRRGLVLKTPHGGSLSIHADGDSYSYCYGPRGVTGLLRNRYATGCAMFASIGGLSFGYDQGVIANVLVMRDFLDRWPVGPWEKGSITAALELGALFGALLSGVLADKYSRRHSIFFASVIFCFGSGLQSGARNLNDLIIGRAIGGFGVGALSMLSPLYMAEISPPELRGSLLAIEQLAIVLGVVFGFWIGFLTRNISSSASWRIPLALQLVPAILLCLGCFLLPPSPRFLILCGRSNDAIHSLAKLRVRTPEEADHDPLIQLELLEMRVNVALLRRSTSAKNDNGIMSGWTELFHSKHRARTLIGVMIMFFQQWSGINALLYYGPTLVRNVGLTGEKVTLFVAGGIGIVQAISVIPVIIYLDRWGGSAVMTISHCLIAILILQYEGDWSSHPGSAWLAVMCIYTFTAAYGMSFGPVGWVLPNEVFPLSMRSKGVALSTASNWINNFFIGLVTPPMMEISSVATFMTFACACFAAFLWSSYIIPETANVSLEEIDRVFNSSAAQEDLQRKLELEHELGVHELIEGLVANCD
ncbi:general substrate transporter [Boletus edulis BED1]|uniref:General substrate transporter n=1 Tax=Boletus edulis BED1 TaxID=1328754 RepID=A0AAD4GL98_BOLED|nr:general substrate transporter [Boletus edulis BED1]